MLKKYQMFMMKSYGFVLDSIRLTILSLSLNSDLKLILIFRNMFGSLMDTQCETDGWKATGGWRSKLSTNLETQFHSIVLKNEDFLMIGSLDNSDSAPMRTPQNLQFAKLLNFRRGPTMVLFSLIL